MNHPVITEVAGEVGAEQAAILPAAAKSGDEYRLLNPKILLPFLLVSLIWGSTWLVIRGQLGTVPESWSVTYRMGFASIGMFILATFMRLPLKLTGRAHLWAMLIGAVQFAANFNLVYAAEHHITSGLVAVIFALLIIPNAILGKLWLGRSVGRLFWAGAAVATTGVGLLMLREYRMAEMAPQAVLLGGALTMMAVVTASISNVLQASDRMMRFPIITVLAWCMAYGAIANSAWSFATAGPPVVEWAPPYLLGVGYLAIIGSVVTFPLYFALIRDIGPGKAAYTSVFIPIVAMLLSTIFEGYHWSALAIAGALLAMAGLVISMQAKDV